MAPHDYAYYTDIDECARGRDNCDINAECINTGGSFLCVCRAGYEGNGQQCTGISAYMTVHVTPSYIVLNMGVLLVLLSSLSCCIYTGPSFSVF